MAGRLLPCSRIIQHSHTFVVRHFLPHLGRDNVWRILKADGLSRRPKPASDRPAKGQGAFSEYDLGFVHIDIKHLPELQTSDGECRKRFLFVAIDRCSRYVHLAVKDDETERSAIAFLREAAAAFPFQLTHVLTDKAAASRQPSPGPALPSARSIGTPAPARPRPTA